MISKIKLCDWKLKSKKSLMQQDFPLHQSCLEIIVELVVVRSIFVADLSTESEPKVLLKVASNHPTWKLPIRLYICFAKLLLDLITVVLFCFVLFLWAASFEWNWVSLMGFSLTSGAGIDGNAPYQAQELQITTLANPGIQTNFLPRLGRFNPNTT